jgi:hypothetical protein
MEMNETGPFWGLVILALLFAPFVVAYGPFRSRSRVGVWKFLALALCVFAVVIGFLGSLLLGVIVWFIAWVFAGVAVTLDTREQPINLIGPARKSMLSMSDTECPHCHKLTNRFAIKCYQCNEVMASPVVLKN